MLDGQIGFLPSAVWDVDLSNNAFRGRLPPLARYVNLQGFVANSNNFTGGVPGLSVTVFVWVCWAHMHVSRCNWDARRLCSHVICLHGHVV